MNRIEIFAPRWKDRKLLIAEWKVGDQNEIVITATKKDGTPFYPNPIRVSGEKLRSYPVVAHKHGRMRECDLDELLEDTHE